MEESELTRVARLDFSPHRRPKQWGTSSQSHRQFSILVFDVIDELIMVFMKEISSAFMIIEVVPQYSPDMG